LFSLTPGGGRVAIGIPAFTHGVIRVKRDEGAVGKSRASTHRKAPGYLSFRICYHRSAILDHLVYGAPDLDHAIDHIERIVGVRPAYGGKHAGGLTHNALLSLGGRSYLELIAPIRDAQPAAELPFGLASVREARLVAWAISVDDLEGRIEAAKKAGYDPGPIVAGGRELPNGASLGWRLAIQPQPAGDSLVPFLIQWQSEPHPSLTSPAGCQFVSLRAEHPDPAGIEVLLNALAVDIPVARGPSPRLIATLDTPNGRLELS
jgi:hypothetical protein